MKFQPSARIALLACASFGMLGVAPAAYAQAPMELSAQVRVEDTTHQLGDTASLEQSIKKLSADKNFNLFVVTIDQFESPSNSQQWTQAFAEKNNLGSNDAVLVIATDRRQAYFDAGGTQVLSDSATNDIYQNKIFPHLRESDYDGAALAAVEGIDRALADSTTAQSQNSPTSATPSGGGVGTGIAVLGGVAAAAAGGAWLFGRRRQSGSSGNSSGSYQPAPYQEPLKSIEELRQEAGALLIKVDDAIVHSEQEVEFARLQYGNEQVKPFVDAIAAAKAQMQRSFQLQKQLDDDIPDTEEEQRSWLGEIITGCREAARTLDEQKQNFTNLRRLESNAPQALDALEERYVQAQNLIPVAQQSLEKITVHYAESAVAPVADNIQQAQARLEFARQTMDKARAELQTNRSHAVLGLRAAEESVGQAEGMLRSVQHAETELAQAQESLNSALLIAERDVAQARELSKFGDTGELAAAAAGVSAVIEQIRKESQQPRIDPLALTRKLSEVRSDLDRALNNVRQVQDQQRSASESLQHTLVSAQAQVHSASEYIWARRGGVQAEARTRLREAERYLAEAQQLQRTDPMTALSSANQAIRLASEAQAIAQNDVNSFGGNGYYGHNRRGGGLDLNSAMLGGILFGQLFGGGNNHSSGGMFGGGGNFGGGFGGGDLGGGDFTGGAGGNF